MCGDGRVVAGEVAHRTEVIDQWPEDTVRIGDSLGHVLLSQNLVDSGAVQLAFVQQNRLRSIAVGVNEIENDIPTIQ